jgi:pimeloyl-ACP methyl ester carboxylesterase
VQKRGWCAASGFPESKTVHTSSVLFRALVLVLLLSRAGQFEVFSAETDIIGSLKTIPVNGVELHYLERGSGTPLVLIHGGLGDCREWSAQLPQMSSRYQVIAYSRRYNFPNDNRGISPDHSALVEAADLAGLIDGLKLGQVHLVGYSYGALTALFYAVQHPEHVRSLTLAEPPVLKWLPDISGGQIELDRFMQTLWKPAAAAFRRGEPETALRIACDYFSGKGSYGQWPQEARPAFSDNFREWKALTTSRDAFPPLDRELVRKLDLPVLLLTGEKNARTTAAD